MTMMAAHLRTLPVLSALFLAATIPALGTVGDVAANGFTVEVTAHVAAPADKVYSALITPAHWWNAEHTFSGNAANLTLDAKAGGCWCERLPDGGSVMHLTVVYVAPGKMLRLRGALGPLQAYPVEGAMTWTLKTAGDGTDLSLTYALGGRYKGASKQWSKGVDGVLTEQVTRLQRLVETGSPEKR